MQHDKTCQQLNYNTIANINGWIKHYPDYCRNCAGWGIHLDSSLCIACTEEGYCPRCMILFESEDYGYRTCRACGFDEYDPQGRPDEPDCICEDVDYMDEE